MKLRLFVIPSFLLSSLLRIPSANVFSTYVLVGNDSLALTGESAYTPSSTSSSSDIEEVKLNSLGTAELVISEMTSLTVDAINLVGLFGP